VRPLFIIFTAFVIGLSLHHPRYAEAATQQKAAKVPSFEISRICRGIKRKEVDTCYRREWAARDSLVKRWAASDDDDRSRCIDRIQSRPLPSYQSLLKCINEDTAMPN
jgi:hypothetical protein